MTTTLDLIRAIESGNSRASSGAFEELVQERVASAIDQRRTEIAQSMFAVEESVVVTEETAELTEASLDEMSDEDLDALIEGYEQLDELSKGTLARYVKKAQSSGSMASFRQGKALGNAGAYSKRPAKKEAHDNAVIANKRMNGIHKAADKLAK